MGNEITSVTTSNGTYYVGMTREEAEKREMYETITGIDFKDLDKPKKSQDGTTLPPDGVLDEEEILIGVKKQSKRRMVKSALMTTMLAGCTGLSMFASPFTGGVAALFTAGFAGETGFFLRDAIDKEKQYKEADRQLSELDVKY